MFPIKNQRGETIEEKAVQLRLYSADKFTAAEEVTAGQLVAVTGLTGTWVGQPLGAEEKGKPWALEPVMTYRVGLPKGSDPAVVLPKLRLLEEEDPQLHILSEGGAIHVQIMGRVQQEVFRALVRQRFSLDVTLEEGGGTLSVSLSEGGGTTDYMFLANKPKINSVELIGDKSGSDLNLQDKMDRVTEHDIDIMMFGDE